MHYYRLRLAQLREYSFLSFRADLTAGLLVALVALPLAMSFAISIGVNPEYGLYAAILGGVVAALFGGSEFNVTGPTGAFVAVLSGVVFQFGYEYLLVAGLLSGMLLLVGGVFKFGRMIEFIPYPVVIGFTSGIAVIIFSTQLGSIFGLTGLERHEYFHENILVFFEQVSTLQWSALLIAVSTAVLMIAIPRLHPKLPSALIGIIVVTVLAVLLGLDVPNIQTVFGGIPREIPAFSFPHITGSIIIQLLPSAAVIAFLGSIESLLSCVISDGMTRKRHDSNAELVGQGIANLLVPFVGGIPVTGALARTAVNVKAGAQTRFSAVFHSLFLLVIMLVFAPLVNFIPLAALGGVLVVVSYRMAEAKHFKELLFSGDRPDAAVMLLTFLLTVFLNITVSIVVGLVLASLLFMKRMSELNVEATVIDRSGEESHFVPTSEQLRCPHISMYTVQGALFFGAARRLVNALQNVHQARALILRLKHVPVIDATGMNALRNILEMHGTEHAIYVVGATSAVDAAMQKAGLKAIIGEDHFFAHTRNAINAALKEQGLSEGCEEYRLQ